MSNGAMLLCYAPFCISAWILLITAFARPDKGRLRIFTVWFNVMLVGWQACELMRYILKDPTAIRIVFDLKLAFVAVMPVLVFLVIAAYYRIDRVFERKLWLALLVIPAITVVFSVTPFQQSWMTRSFQVLAVEPVTEIAFERGPYFYVHTVYSYVVVLVAALMIARFDHNLPRTYRNGSVLMIASLTCCWAGLFIETLRFVPVQVDLNMISVTVGSILMYLSTLVSGRMDTLHAENKEFLNYLDEAVFILGPAGEVVDVNTEAAAFLKKMRQPERPQIFDEMLKNLTEQGRISRHKPVEEGQDGEDLYIVDAQYPLVLRMVRQAVFGRDNQKEGAYALLSDTTQNRLLIERLRSMSGIDALTGIANQFQFRIEMRRLDREENLPLSLLIGDISGLHGFNEQQGREQGDRVLIGFVGLLRRYCPEDGVLARTGGHQFTMLLPRFSGEATRSLVAELGTLLVHENILVPGMGLKVEWKHATKTQAVDNLNALIDETDWNGEQPVLQ